MRHAVRDSPSPNLNGGPAVECIALVSSTACTACSDCVTAPKHALRLGVCLVHQLEVEDGAQSLVHLEVKMFA